MRLMVNINTEKEKKTLNREKEHGQQITISHLGMDNKMF